MKTTILLTATLFLMSAPSPDSKSVSEFSGGFLAETSDLGLMASGPTEALVQSLAKELTPENEPESQNERLAKPLSEQDQTN